jgi:tetratricopeptide (TPR) repeat protein
LRARAEESATAARKSEELATARFQDVRALARTFLFEFDPLIRRLPGSAPARKLLVAKGLEYLDSLARESQTDADLLRELASAYLVIGDVQGDVASTNLGDFEGALGSYRKAEALLGALLKADPRSKDAGRLRQLCYNKSGDVLAALGRHPESMEAHRAALELATRLVELYPDVAEFRGLRANALERMGNALAHAGEIEAAREHYEASRRLAEDSLTGEAPQDAWARRGVGVGYTKIANLLVAQGKPAEALEYWRKYRAIAEQLVASAPADIIARRDLITADQWIGILSADLGQPEAAIAAFRSSLEVNERLLAEDPDAVDTRLLLVTTGIKLGETLLKGGRLDEARAAFERCAQQSEEQVRRSPQRPDARRLRGVSFYKLYEHEKRVAESMADSPAQRAEHTAAACAWLRRCLEVFETMARDGVLAQSDAGVPDELRGELEAFERAPAATEQAASQPD